MRRMVALPRSLSTVAVAKGLVILQPNESVVCRFGSYVGNRARPGVVGQPSIAKDQRFRAGSKLGGRAPHGSTMRPANRPIGAVIVGAWEDACEGDERKWVHAKLVKAQSETALRRMASVHPYERSKTWTRSSRRERTKRADGGPMHDVRR